MTDMRLSLQAPVRRAPLAMPPVIMAAAGFLVAMVLVALIAGFLAPYHFTTQDLAARFRPPIFAGGDWAHMLGTDHLGRDILSRIIYAIRSSLLIAFAGTLIGAVFGTLMGFAAGRLRGIVDQTVMMLVDAQAAVPALFLALTLLAFFGNNILLFVVIVSLDGWDRYTRLARGLVVSEQASDYITAVEALGAGSARVILRHLLPNIVASLVVQATLNFPGTVLLETSLSFLGLGVQPPGTSLGLMLGEGRRYLLNAWWIAVLPGIVIFLTTLSMSLFGDWLRDRLDPTLAGKG
ncbi:ABC transporter permease [Phyllobacteriaceae bacterium SYSU D60012]|uniref:ABC transporter permease n=1 Tax=Taklimakanibacter lacteus TaxID=2268456 RepID=UPI000E6677B2